MRGAPTSPADAYNRRVQHSPPLVPAFHRARRAFLLAVIVATASCGARGEPALAPVYDDTFWRVWGDGQAEVSGYSLRRPRYGEQRAGTLVLVFVTEPWSVSAHVKADEGKHPAGDVIQVLKQNAMESFQTGIYDYHMMTSSWTALTPAGGRPAGASAKLAFSAQEWCGTTWAELTFGPAGAQELVRSYFDGESGARTLDNPQGGTKSLVEDAVLVWARGLASPLLARGGSTEVAFLPAVSRARLLHKPLAWTTATLAREPKTSTVTVPAGTFEVESATVTIAAGAAEEARSLTVLVEAAAPRRIVKVTSSDGTMLELTGSMRTPYWQKNREGDEALLRALGTTGRQK